MSTGGLKDQATTLGAQRLQGEQETLASPCPP